jgi:aspartate carbamoyltransferase catalytic subunit
MSKLTQDMPLRHYLQFADLSADDYAHIFKRAAFIKAKFKSYENIKCAK